MMQACNAEISTTLRSCCAPPSVPDCGTLCAVSENSSFTTAPGLPSSVTPHQSCETAYSHLVCSQQVVSHSPPSLPNFDDPNWADGLDEYDQVIAITSKMEADLTREYEKFMRKFSPVHTRLSSSVHIGSALNFIPAGNKNLFSLSSPEWYEIQSPRDFVRWSECPL